MTSSINANFLCFTARHWFNNFMLRKLNEHGGYCFTHFWAEDFPGWTNNYHEYILPVDHTTQPDFLLVDNTFFVNRRRVFGYDYMREFMRRKSGNYSVPVVGIDHCDVILSKYDATDVDCFDVILKGHGLPRDRDLMNWEIGPRWGLNRSQKLRQIRHKRFRLSSQQIEKFKVSFDMGVAYCDASLRQPSNMFEPIDVFFVGTFDSLNRLTGLKLCKRHFRTVGWLVRAAEDHPIPGIEDWKADPEVNRSEDKELLVHTSRELCEANRECFRNRIPKWRYRFLASLSKITPAFSGIGELGPRHYQALAFGKVLLCEDLSYIEGIYPFQDGENCVFVNDRLEDLVERVRWLLEDRTARRRIARRGFDQLRETYRDGDRIFRRYFLDYLGG